MLKSFRLKITNFTEKLRIKAIMLPVLIWKNNEEESVGLVIFRCIITSLILLPITFSMVAIAWILDFIFYTNPIRTEENIKNIHNCNFKNKD